MYVHYARVEYALTGGGLCAIHCLMQGMAQERKEARAEKEEAEKYQKFQQELVSYSSVV